MRELNRATVHLIGVLLDVIRTGLGQILGTIVDTLDEHPGITALLLVVGVLVVASVCVVAVVQP